MAEIVVLIPDDLLGRIDREAARRGTTRGGFLQRAARRELEWAGGDRLDEALERGRAALEGAGAFESADLIREARDAHDGRDRRR